MINNFNSFDFLVVSEKGEVKGCEDSTETEPRKLLHLGKGGKGTQLSQSFLQDNFYILLPVFLQRKIQRKNVMRTRIVTLLYSVAPTLSHFCIL